MLNTPDEHGASLIHYLTALNENEIVEILCKYGVDKDLKVAQTNFNPLMIAAARNLEQIFNTLQSYGA